MTSDPTTWTDLKTSLANWLGARDDLNTVEIPEAIALAERRFQRTIFTPDRDTDTTLSASAESVALPTDLWGIKSIYISADPKVVLEQMTLNQLRETHAAAATGQPQHYAVDGGNLILGPAPDATYSLKLTYTQTIPALGSGQATNWLLTRHPDVYLFGGLAELHALLADNSKVGLFEGKLALAIDEIDKSGRRRSNGGPPQRIRPPSCV